MSLKTAFFFLIFPACATAQVLTTASTVGKGTTVAMLSENHLFVDGTDLNIGYAQYIHGVTKTFDFYASVGTTNFAGENQEWVGAGGNLHLFQAAKFDVSLYSVVSVPVNRRNEASTVLLNSAVVVSREINKTLTLYSGGNGLFPIGAKERGFFTPTTRKLNVPAGAAISHGKWVLFFEGDIGRLKAVGVGVGYAP
jgi:hypothetical protein